MSNFTPVYFLTAMRLSEDAMRYAHTVPAAAPFTFIAEMPVSVYVIMTLNTAPIQRFLTGMSCLPMPWSMPVSVCTDERKITPTASTARHPDALAALSASAG